MSQPQSGGIHSTGRGGAGNIGPDPSTYVDGDIIREGTPGVSTTAEYSTGRGGTGNIAHASTTNNHPSEEIVPESATRVPGESYENYHTGRGGEGNVHREKFGGHSHAQKEGGGEGFVEKVKHAVGLDGHHHKKEKTPEPGKK
ncbi:hypothetical protein M409DRAFT_56654 [Zasmidium cellare ATCC 36951]|uniref:Uncharacterized protein n=1 Tax=Zasmidium cellare ATCC 36951 TaxID=1080233 RepID=A0A6A6CB25_ZASCE|nr:uncharacterized protein M409DRAFT_56654 [Zasmidium cellare ATCC 36951]KAF2164384.1 hypothetical protein M409DRAFT_56654 [Zasmidium cellare ATCC 36951]